MTLDEMINRAMFMATDGQIPPDDTPIISRDLAAEAWVPEVLYSLAVGIAGDLEQQHLLTKTFPVTLIDGVGTLPPNMLSEFLCENSVRDGAGFLTGSAAEPLVRVHHYDDFIRYLPFVFKYYCIEGDKIYAKQGPAALPGPLTISAPFVPASPEEIPETLTADALTLLAARIRYGVDAQRMGLVPTNYKTSAKV
jgi:hypothetical protein